MGGFIRNQASVLLDSIFIGMVIMSLYDALRLFRRVIRHKRFLRDFEDFVFWIMGGFIVFSLVYSRSNGNIRWFIIVGVIFGAYIYEISFGQFLVKYIAKYINKFINNILKKPFRKSIMSIKLLFERIAKVNGKKLREKKEDS